MGYSCLGMVECQPSRRNSYKSSERAECPGEELRDSDAAVVTRPGPQMWTGPGRGSHEAGCVWGGDFVLGSLRPVMKTREAGGRAAQITQASDGSDRSVAQLTRTGKLGNQECWGGKGGECEVSGLLRLSG